MDRYEYIVSQTEKEKERIKKNPPKWTRYNLSKIVPASVKASLQTGRNALVTAQKAGAATVNGLEAIKTFVSLMSKVEAALQDTVATAAHLVASQVRDLSKQFESVGVYALPIANITKKKKKRSKHTMSGVWWGTELEDGSTETWADKQKRLMKEIVVDELYGTRDCNIEPQTFLEFKKWLASKFSEDEPSWAENSDIGDSSLLGWTNKRQRWKPKRVGAPYTTYGDVYAWVVVAAVPDIEEFTDAMATISELTGIIQGDLAKSAKAASSAFRQIKNKIYKEGSEGEFLDDIYSIVDKVKKVWGESKPQMDFSSHSSMPYWIGMNAGTIFPEVFQALGRIADTIEAIEYKKQLTFLDAVSDSISGAQNAVKTLMEIIQQIDRLIFLLQKLLTMPGLYMVALHSEVNTDSLISSIMALESPWEQELEEKYKAVIAKINTKYDALRTVKEESLKIQLQIKDSTSEWLAALAQFVLGMGLASPLWYDSLPAWTKTVLDNNGYSKTNNKDINADAAIKAYASIYPEKYLKTAEYMKSIEAIAAIDRSIAEIEEKRTLELAEATRKKTDPLVNMGKEKRMGSDTVRVVSPEDMFSAQKNEKMYYLGFVVSTCIAKGPGELKTYTQAMAEEYENSFQPVISSTEEVAAQGKKIASGAQRVLKLLGLG